MKKSATPPVWIAYAVGGVLALGWLLKQTTEGAARGLTEGAGNAAGEMVRATGDAIGDTAERIGDAAVEVFEAWTDFYGPGLDVAEAALYALGEIADQPAEAVQEAWEWWRQKFDPDRVTPAESPVEGQE